MIQGITTLRGIGAEMNITGNISAILLAADENSTRVDRNALRHVGVRQLRVATSGHEILALLQSNMVLMPVFAASTQSNPASQAGQAETRPVPSAPAFPKPDIIICHEEMADMDVLSFLEELSALELHIPVLVVQNSSKNLGRLNRQSIQKAGADAILERPYTISGLESVLSRILNLHTASKAEKPEQKKPAANFFSNFTMQAAKPAQKPWPDAQKNADAERQSSSMTGSKASQNLEKFASPKYRVNEAAQSLVQQGLAQIRADNMETAESFLQEALKIDPINAEACLAMARVTRANQRSEDVFGWMQRAAGCYMRRGELSRAQSVFARMPGQGEKSSSNPCMKELTSMMQEGLYTEASKAFIAISEENPDLSLNHMIGRACQFTSDPEQALREICHVLKHSGHAAMAKKLHHRMLYNDHSPIEPSLGAFWRKFPRLYEIVSIASYTVQSLKQAGA